jgi:tRNA 2-selenouridine synthase
MTGRGKTDMLIELENLGAQVINLEKLAHHKGSVFGALVQTAQPTSEQFDNNLAEQWREFDYDKPIWLEDESNSIGSVWINLELFNMMRESKLIKVSLPTECRVNRLVKEYAIFGADNISNMLSKIQKRLGGQNLKRANELLAIEDYKSVAEIALKYYDKTYNYGIEKRNQDKIINIELASDNPAEAAKKLIELV